jgi:beta-lactamase class A
MIERRWLFGLTILALLGCTAPASPPLRESALSDPRLESIERRAGGRLGVALVDGEGRSLLVHRPGERFAMCSTFKLALAAMVLDGAARGRWSLGDALPVTDADILAHSPITEPWVASGRMPLAEATAAIITHSDNAAANLILRRIGGPAALTAWLRAQGDPATRLDRNELELNQNGAGDVRDTTTPRAFAETARRMLIAAGLPAAGRAQLRNWTIASETGRRRIRAGLPAGWAAGDKTGSCGTAWNDVAWFTNGQGRSYALAVYLDRPAVSGAEAEAVIAEVARIAATIVAR